MDKYYTDVQKELMPALEKGHKFSGQVYLKTLAPINLTNEDALANNLIYGIAETIPVGATCKVNAEKLTRLEVFLL